MRAFSRPRLRHAAPTQQSHHHRHPRRSASARPRAPAPSPPSRRHSARLQLPVPLHPRARRQHLPQSPDPPARPRPTAGPARPTRPGSSWTVSRFVRSKRVHRVICASASCPRPNATASPSFRQFSVGRTAPPTAGPQSKSPTRPTPPVKSSTPMGRRAATRERIPL